MALTITPNQPPGRPHVPGAPPQQQGTDGVAVLALVLAFLLPLAGLVLGIVALVRTKVRPGRGLAVAATVVSAVGVLMLPVLAAIAIPVFLDQREQAWQTQIEAGLREGAVEVETRLVSGETVVPGETLPSSQPEVTVVLAGIGDLGYCLAGTHALSGTTLFLDSASLTVSEVPCA